MAASALALACASPTTQGAQVDVEVSRSGSRFEVKAVARLHTDTATAFATLTDYEHLPRFVPDVHDVRVLRRERHGEPSPQGEGGAQERLVVDQRGEFRIWWFSQPVQIRLDVLHLNGDEVRASLAAMPAHNDGDAGRLESFAGRYKLETVAGAGGNAVRLTYDAYFVPQFRVPRLIGTQAVRHTVTGQFAAMAEEIERRFAAR